MIVCGPVTTAELPAVDSDAGLCSVAKRCGGCPRIFDPTDVQRRDKALRVARLLAEAQVALPHAPYWILRIVRRLPQSHSPGVGRRPSVFLQRRESVRGVVFEPALQTATNDFWR